MKKILAIAAVAALTAGVSAYAANPFSDVSTSDWAYQAVSELSEQGIVEGMVHEHHHEEDAHEEHAREKETSPVMSWHRSLLDSWQMKISTMQNREL